MAKKSYFMKKNDLLVKIIFLFNKLDQKLSKNAKKLPDQKTSF